MSMRELREWAVLEAIEPYGEMGNYLRMATICAVLVNIHRDPKKSEAAKPSDFMPNVDQRQQEQKTLNGRPLGGLSLDDAFEFMWRIAMRNDKIKGLIH